MATRHLTTCLSDSYLLRNIGDINGPQERKVAATIIAIIKYGNDSMQRPLVTRLLTSYNR